jgi:DNA primase large subunit
MNRYLDLVFTDGYKITDQRCSLVNVGGLERGFLYMEIPRIAYVLRLVLEQKLKTRIKDIVTNNEQIKTAASDLDQKFSYIYNNNNVLSAPSTGYPPCISHILEKVEKEHHLTHDERILASCYMMSKGVTTEWLDENIFRKLSDYKPRVTLYQLNFLKKYKVPNCGKVQLQGLCYKDQYCSRIKNPYQYYRNKKS